MYCLTSGYRTEPFSLPDLFAWLEDHPNPLGCRSLPDSNLSPPQHPAKGLGKSPAAVRSRAACAEASLQMQKLEVRELSTSPAQPPQPQPCPWCCSPAVQSLCHVPAHPQGGTAVPQGERMLSSPGAEHPHHHPEQMPEEQHRTRSLPVTGKGQSLPRGLWALSSPGPAGLCFPYKAVPGTGYSPSAPQPALLPLLHTRLLPPKGKKPEERQS